MLEFMKKRARETDMTADRSGSAVRGAPRCAKPRGPPYPSVSQSPYPGAQSPVSYPEASWPTMKRPNPWLRVASETALVCRADSDSDRWSCVLRVLPPYPWADLVWQNSHPDAVL